MTWPIAREQRGASTLTTVVFGALLAVVVFVAYNVLPFYYYYFDLKNQFQQVIRVASVDTDEEIRRKIMVFIKQYGVPIDPEDLRIERYDDTMKISLKYTEIFYVTFRGKEYTIHKFNFDATTEGKFK